MDTTQTRTPRAAKPAGAGVDLDPARRPGVPKERAPARWPNTRYPPAGMQGRSSTPKRGRQHRPMPPVFSTAVPPRGISGALRIFAYRYPDHYMRHWTLLLFADRVESWGTRSWRLLRVGIPAIAIFLGARAFLDRR